jgi:hypothetical protein
MWLLYTLGVLAPFAALVLLVIWRGRYVSDRYTYQADRDLSRSYVPDTLELVHNSLVDKPALLDYGPIQSGEQFTLRTKTLLIEYQRLYEGTPAEQLRLLQAPFCAGLEIKVVEGAIRQVTIDHVRLMGPIPDAVRSQLEDLLDWARRNSPQLKAKSGAVQPR